MGACGGWEQGREPRWSASAHPEAKWTSTVRQEQSERPQGREGNRVAIGGQGQVTLAWKGSILPPGPYWAWHPGSLPVLLQVLMETRVPATPPVPTSGQGAPACSGPAGPCSNALQLCPHSALGRAGPRGAAGHWPHPSQAGVSSHPWGMQAAHRLTTGCGVLPGTLCVQLRLAGPNRAGQGC